MKIYILTLFPDFFIPFCQEGVIAQAISKGKVNISVVNFRDFSHDKHKKVDDLSYGGGGGMVLKPEPIYNAYHSIPEEIRQIAKTIIPTPRAKLYNQAMAMEFAREEALIIIAGRYKGLDERIFELTSAERVSVGNFVFSGGELPAMMITESIVRLLPDVLTDIESALSDSFTAKSYLLGYPVYTRPESFNGLDVPPVLLSGNHEVIRKWRLKEALRTTYKYRPELLNKNNLATEEKKLLEEVSMTIKKIPIEERGRNVR